MNGYSRRTLLKGLGGFALTLPLLEARLAQANPMTGGVPKRFIVMWTPNGTVPNKWKPTATAAGYDLTGILQPLEAMKQDVLVIDGVDALSAYKGPGDAHQKGTGQCLTGTELQEGSFLGAGGLSAGWANGISIDQAIANKICTDTRFKSLELGVYVHGANVNSRISYQGPAQPLPPENDPAAAFERIFGTPGESDAQKAARLAQRKSVLDAVAARYQRLLPKLGGNDRQKLESHLTAIREIEVQLTNAANAQVCVGPQPVPTIDPMSIPNIPKLGKLQTDILVAAMACDLTRVGSLMWMNSATDKTYPWLGVNEGHHALSHMGDDDLHAQESLTKIYTWYAEQFGYLIQKLKSVPEGEGTMLDNTFVIWVSEHSRGNIHDRHALPYVAAGRAGGQVKPGRWLQLGGEVPHNNLWVSCLNMFGVPAQTFGNPQYCTGPLSGLAG